MPKVTWGVRVDMRVELRLDQRSDRSLSSWHVTTLTLALWRAPGQKELPRGCDRRLKDKKEIIACQPPAGTLSGGGPGFLGGRRP